MYLLPVLLCCSLALLIGCGTTSSTIEPAEMQAIREGKRALVLFRLTMTSGGTNDARSAGSRVRWRLWSIGTNWTELDPVHGRNGPPRWRSLSETTDRQGWRFLLLKPGNYYMEVAPDFVREASSLRRRELPEYYLSVPSEVPVVYGGSFLFTQRKEVITNPFQLFRPPGGVVIRLEPQGVRDESREAEEICRTALTDLGPMASSMAWEYMDYKTALSRYPSARVEAIECTNSCTVSNTRRIMTRWFWWGYEDFVKGLDRLNVPSLPELIRERLAETASVRSTDTNSSPRLKLHLNFYRLRLQPIEGKHALDIAVHVRFVEAVSGKVAWETGLVYAASEVTWRNVTERFIEYNSTPYRLKYFEGESGARLFEDELNYGMRGFADTIAAIFTELGIALVPQDR
jgi:hypothetical protein